MSLKENTLNILIAEDNPVDTRLIESMLKDMTGTVQSLDVVISVQEALGYINSKNYDVIILDLNLPDSDGLDTIKKIAEIAPELPLVINTGENEEKIGVAAVAAGAEDFLVKGKYTAYILSKTLHYAIERKRIEVELKCAYSALQDAQEHLIESEKMKVVGGLATGIAHEVKNPLATISYAATYLADHVTSDNKNYETVVTNIKDAVERADSIIMDLLDFAAIREVSKKPMDLNALINKTLKLISFQFEKKSIRIKRDYGDGLDLVEVDENRIDQVILNVLLNAHHAVGLDGEIKIKTFASTLDDVRELTDGIDLRDEDVNQNVVIVQFSDNGCGISENKIKNIFEPFYTTRRAKGGVGLGLSVVKNIIDRHNAFVTIKNNEDSGVTVSLIFKVSGGV